MQTASRLELHDPAKATALWTTIDHQLTDNAGWVPTVNPRAVELVSKRLRNYQYTTRSGASSPTTAGSDSRSTDSDLRHICFAATIQERLAAPHGVSLGTRTSHPRARPLTAAPSAMRSRALVRPDACIWCKPAGAGGQFSAGESSGPEPARQSRLREPRFCIVAPGVTESALLLQLVAGAERKSMIGPDQSVDVAGGS